MDSLSLLSTRIFIGNELKGKMRVCFQFPSASPDQHSLTQAQQWRREAALGKAGKLSRPPQRYLLSGICWRSSVTATNLRYFWMLQRKTDCIKRDSAKIKQKSWRGSSWTTFVIVSLPSLVFPCLHSPLGTALSCSSYKALLEEQDMQLQQRDARSCSHTCPLPTVVL